MVLMTRRHSCQIDTRPEMDSGASKSLIERLSTDFILYLLIQSLNKDV